MLITGLAMLAVRQACGGRCEPSGCAVRQQGGMAGLKVAVISMHLLRCIGWHGCVAAWDSWCSMGVYLSMEGTGMSSPCACLFGMEAGADVGPCCCG